MTLFINGKTYEAGELIAYVKKLEKENAELKRKYQELVDKLHHCWNCKKSFDKSCSFGKMLEADKKKCKDCNVWNYLYDIKALQKWCKEHNEDFMQFTMKMHKMLKESE